MKRTRKKQMLLTIATAGAGAALIACGSDTGVTQSFSGVVAMQPPDAGDAGDGAPTPLLFDGGTPGIVDSGQVDGVVPLPGDGGPLGITADATTD